MKPDKMRLTSLQSVLPFPHATRGNANDTHSGRDECFESVTLWLALYNSFPVSRAARALCALLAANLHDITALRRSVDDPHRRWGRVCGDCTCAGLHGGLLPRDDGARSRI
jgi:hypothetical protein